MVDEEDAESGGVLGLIKSAAGNASLETMLVEIDKLEAVRAIGLPAGLFADVTPRVLWPAGASRRRSSPRRICAGIRERCG